MFVFFKNRIHESLEGCQGVCEAEGYHEELIVSFVDSGRCFVRVGYIHLDLMVPKSQVNF